MAISQCVVLLSGIACSATEKPRQLNDCAILSACELMNAALQRSIAAKRRILSPDGASATQIGSSIIQLSTGFGIGQIPSSGLKSERHTIATLNFSEICGPIGQCL